MFSELSDNVPELHSEIKKLKSEAEALRKQVLRLQLERDILEKAAEIIKKDQGINLENLTNQEKTELIDVLRTKYRLKILLEALHISKSSYCYQASVMRQEDKYAELTHTSHIKYAYQPMLHKRSVVKTTFQDSKATLFTADSVRNKYTGRLPIT